MTEQPTTDTFHEADRERVLAQLRVARLEHQLAVAHLDLLGCLLKNGLMQPYGVRAALSDITGQPTEEGGER